ncbi:hypothetical protein FA15DRAFT_669265 [Coprinopsis marcescibilis]|uniref:DUF6533 domain-containing protein n=1 Tax=Coprinopsis marcescibilis TaxID=230819 RepID=A0A5C3KWZ9_COPMA|nr:hypothetical protein FA15DRAFT_669265 [Coprinopsis marcescibilis]
MNLFRAACWTLLIVEHLHLLPSEIQYVWKTRWSLVKALFLITRYLSLLEIVLVCQDRFWDKTTQEACRTSLIITLMTGLTIVTCAEAILFIRVYAFSGHARPMLYYLSLQYIVVHGGQLVAITLTITKARFTTEREYHHPGTHCIVDFASTHVVDGLIFGTTISFAISGILLVLIMSWLGYTKYRHVPITSLVPGLIRDGVAYYLLISVVVAVKITILLAYAKANEDRFLNHGLAEGQVIIHSLLACRLVLQLRQLGDTASTSTQRERIGVVGGHNNDQPFQPIQFASNCHSTLLSGSYTTPHCLETA